MERQFLHVPEPRAPDKPDDGRGSRSIWSRIYSVITHPFRVIGNLLCLSRRGTSEDHSPGHIQDTIEYREATSISEQLEFELDVSLPPKAASASEPLEVEIEKNWTSVPLEDDNMRWLGAMRVRPHSSDDEYEYVEINPWLGVSDDSSNIIIRRRKKHDDLVLHTRKLSNKGRDLKLSDIGKIETEKPVAAWHPVPPAPPPPNPPI